MIISNKIIIIVAGNVVLFVVVYYKISLLLVDYITIDFMTSNIFGNYLVKC